MIIDVALAVIVRKINHKYAGTGRTPYRNSAALCAGRVNYKRGDALHVTIVHQSGDSGGRVKSAAGR